MTRTKTVFDTRQCAHVWAQQTQQVGRNASSSVSFEGATFYSYRTPIALIVDATAYKGAERMSVALISSEGYSKTTRGKHLPAVHRAVANSMPSFTVPFVFPHSRGCYRLPLKACGTEAQTWRAIHEANCAYLNHKYNEQVESFMRGRVWYGSDQSATEHVRGCLKEITDLAERYARLFDVPSPNFPVDEDTARIIARRVRIESDPKRAAKAVARARAREHAEQVRHQQEALRNVDRIAKFRAGEQVGHVSDADGCAMLRLSADGTEVETSWGARAPVSHVRSALQMWTAVTARGATWPDPVHGPGFVQQLGNFTLDRIDADGNVRAGCHRITAREVTLLKLELEGVTS